MFELTGLLLAAAGVWFWMDSLKAREIGIGEARAACAADGLQLLDDTVAVDVIRFARNDEGRLTFRRTYGFEYSDTGNNRRRGYVTLIGRQVIALYTGPKLVIAEASTTIH
jgi:hypothetical protein